MTADLSDKGLEELLRKLESEPDEDGTCLECHKTTDVREGFDPTPLCDGCTQNALPALVQEVRAQRSERDAAREALGRILDMMSPMNRERFVMRGPMALVSIYEVARAALSAPESKKGT